MIEQRARTAEGDAATAVVLEIFRVNGLVLADGNRLAVAEGLTAARWQVLGAVALAGRPLTVLTELGSRKYAAVDQRQSRWINELAAGLQITDLAAAARVLRDLGDRLESSQRHGAEKGQQ